MVILSLTYTFDRDLFRFRSLGGTGWLDDHDGPGQSFGTSAVLQQSFSSPLDHAEGFENEPAGFDSPNSSYNKNIFLSTKQSFSKSQNSQHPESAEMSAGHCVCDPENAEMLKDTIRKDSQDSSIVKPSAKHARINPSAGFNPVGGVQQCCGEPKSPASIANP